MMRLLRKMQNNWVAKVLSFLGAVLMWFYVMKEQNPITDATYTVPVHVQNLSDKYVVEDIPKQVIVHLRGPRNTILALAQNSLRAYVDLGDISPGQQNVPIQFVSPSGLALVSMTPDNATISVDEYMVKEFPVEVQQLGKVADDIAVKKISTVPKVVSVSGPKRLVATVSHVLLKVNMVDRKSNFTSSGVITAVNAAGGVVDGVTITPRQGQAQLELEQIRFEKNLPVTVSTVGEVPAGYVVRSITVDPQQAVVSGKESAIGGLSEIRTVDIPLQNATETFAGDYELRQEDGMTAVPTRVHVTVDIRKKLLGDTNAKSH